MIFRQFSGYASENDFITEGYSLYQLLEADAVADVMIPYVVIDVITLLML